MKNNAEKVIERYVESWNETDAEARRALLAEIWAEDGTYVDPLVAVTGHAAIDAAIAGAQEQFAGLRFRLVPGVDAHHDQARFTWELGPDGGDAIVVGFDVAVLAGDGRLQAVYGFLDKVPA
jgi:SnoaL-like domain